VDRPLAHPTATSLDEDPLMHAHDLLRATSGAALLLIVFAAGAAAQADEARDWLERCRSGATWGDRDRERVCEVRETTLAAGQPLTVDGRANGGISVRGWDRNEILVQAQITAVDESAGQAAATARDVRILTDGRSVRAEGPSARGRDGWWSVSYRVYVPRDADLDLRASNGGLSLRDVSGRIRLETSNGGISLAGVAGDVQGRTSNGGVTVRLTGDRWRGTGLDLRTSNGGVTLHVPDGYSAQLETGTVYGSLQTDIPITVQGRIRRDLDVQLGQGGAPIRVRTTNGGVRIRRT
jgi:hypothetical protein